MKKVLNIVLLSVLLLVGQVHAQMVSTSLFLQGAYLEAGFQKNSSMGSGGTGSTIPSGYHARGSSASSLYTLCSVGSLASVYDWGHDGWGTGTPAYMGDYTLPGSPFDGWGIEANNTCGYGFSTTCSGSTFSGPSLGATTLTGSHTSHTSAGGKAIGIWDGSFLSGDLLIHKEHRIDTMGSALIFTVKLYNVSSTAISGVYFFHTCDPDISVPWGGSYATINQIPYQTVLTPDPYNRVEVTATATPSTSTVSGAPPCTLSLGTKDCRAKALIFSNWGSTSTISSVPLHNIWAQSGISSLGTTYYAQNSNSGSQDIAIAICFNIGTIPAGDSAFLAYSYIYNGVSGVDSAFPEPQLAVNNVVVSDSSDTATGCPVNVNILNGDDRVWTWSHWTWAPSTGLAATTGTSNIISPSAITSPTIYTITGTSDSAGACASKTFLLTVLPASSTPPIARDTAYCLGITPPDVSGLVTGLPGGTLMYYTTAVGGVGTTIPPVPYTGAIGVYEYYVSQIISFCESTRDTIRVTVAPPPTITLGTGGPYCIGERITITLSDSTGATGLTYRWTGPGGFTATTQNIIKSFATVADSGIYTAVADNNGCSTFPTSILVVVHDTPGSPTIFNPYYCQDSASFPLFVIGDSVLWYSAGTGGIGSTIAPTPSTAVPGVYTWYVTQTRNGCTSSRYPVTDTILPTPLIPIISNDPGSYCPGARFNAFTYAPGTSAVIWYAAPVGGVGTTTQPVPNTTIPDTTFIYYATQRIRTCESPRTPVSIVIYDSVKAHFTNVVNWGCNGDTVHFNNTSYGAVNYLWSFGDGYTSALANPTHIYNTQGLYTISLYAHSLYCVDSQQASLPLIHPNVPSFSLSPSVVCQGSPVTFTDASVSTGPSYMWSFGDGYSSTVVNPNHTYNHPGGYNIMLVVKDFVPCYDTAYGYVSVDSNSDMTLTVSDTTICRGAHVTLSANYSNIGNTDFVFNYGNGDSSHYMNPVVYAYSAVGVYTVTATARYRVCPEVSRSSTVRVFAQPEIDLGPDTSICEGSVAISIYDLVNTGNPSANWIWNTGETTSGINVAAHGVYFATVSMNGCSATDSVIIYDDCYLSFPSCFTPNNDGVNDYFNPRDYMLKNAKTFKFDVYNRWGQLIFETSNLNGKGWDGKFNDVPQPTGVYIYSVEATFLDGQRLKRHGNITLMK